MSETATVLSTALHERLGERRAALERELPAPLLAQRPGQVDEVFAGRRVQRYLDFLTPAFQDQQRHIEGEHGAAACDAFNRLLLIDLLRGFDPHRFIPDKAPPWLLERYLGRVEFIADQVLAAPPGEYAAMSESLLKDLRLLGGVSFPNQDSLLDWQAYLPPTLYRRKGWRQNLKTFAFIWLKAGGLGPYLRVHVDTRFIAQRREVGFLRRHHEAAEILMACPEIRGQVSTSWLHDPVLADISPRLWELSAHVLRHGAFFRRDGYNELDVERATATSKTRRRLYEEGKYRPCCYTYVWHRRAMIAWHHATKVDEAAA